MPPPASPALWYSADVGNYKDAGVTPCADGDTIVQVTDRSGNGFHAGLVPFATNPIYRASPAPTASLGLPLMDFGNVAAGMHTNFNLGATPYTILAVFSGPATPAFCRAVDGSLANWTIGPLQGFLANYAAGYVSQNASPPVVVNTLYRCIATNDGTASAFFVDGTDYTQNSAFTSVPTTLNLGAAGNAAQGLGAYFAELVAYTRAFTPTERAQGNAYLGRWITAPPPGGPWPFFMDNSLCGGFSDMGL
jgi:hypothetical protein